MKSFAIVECNCGNGLMRSVHAVRMENGETRLFTVRMEHVGDRYVHTAEAVDLKTVEFSDELPEVLLEAVQDQLAGGDGKARVSNE